MRRLFWVAVGAVGSIAVARRLRQAAGRFTPEGAAEQAVVVGRGAVRAVTEAVEAFREGFTRRQEELITALLVEPEVSRSGDGRGPDDESVPAAFRGAAGRSDEDEPADEF